MRATFKQVTMPLAVPAHLDKGSTNGDRAQQKHVLTCIGTR